MAGVALANASSVGRDVCEVVGSFHAAIVSGTIRIDDAARSLRGCYNCGAICRLASGVITLYRITFYGY